MKDSVCKIINITQPGSGFCIIELENEYISRNARPGNFVMVQIPDSPATLLRRPFGILDARPGVFRLFFEVVGSGTRTLAGLQKGAHISILGPLGNSFPEDIENPLLIIAGGRGIVPLFFAMSVMHKDTDITLIYGASSRKTLHLVNEIADFQLKSVRYFTEDGSFGNPGLVTDNFGRLMTQTNFKTTFSCGPHGLLKSLAAALKNYSTTDYTSAEALMGCGFGVCHSCAVAATDGSYLKVCSDGPVFPLENLRW